MEAGEAGEGEREWRVGGVGGEGQAGDVCFNAGYNVQLSVTVDLKPATMAIGRAKVLEGILDGGDVELGLSLAR